LWAITTGTGFVKTYYDKDAGPRYNGIPGGDPVVDVCSPFELLIDPYARDLSEASWVLHERVRSRQYVKERYGKDVSGAPPTSILMNVVGALRTTVNTSRLPSTTVCEYWEKPNPKNHEGHYLVFSGNTVLYEGPNPYADVCPIPFSSMVHTPIAGELYGATWVSDARQVNVVYNRLRNDILENAVKLSNPPLLAPMGAIPGEVKMNPGEVITYNPLVMQGGKIDQLQVTPFPAQAVNMLVRLEQEADELAAVTALTRGGVPRGVRSAQQLNVLESMEDQRRQITLQEYTKMMEDSQAKVLQLARKYMTLPRQVNGGNNAVFILRGEDIPQDAMVKITVNLDRPEPDQREEERLFALFDRRIIQDPRLLVRLLKYGSNEELFTDIDLDEAQAQRENERLASGVFVQAEDFQNHVIHLVEHNRFRKTETFDNLPPERRDLFAKHVATHQQFLQQQQMVNQQPGGGNSAPGQQQNA
jgi:DNA-directed RNA polymerase specialized sigma24 family protein